MSKNKHVNLRRFRRYVASSLAIAMTLSAVLPGVPGVVSNAANSSPKKVVKELGDVDGDTMSGLLADGLSKKAAKKAESMSDEYWQEAAPSDFDEAASQYAKVYKKKDTKDGIDMGGNGAEGAKKSEKVANVDKLELDTYEKKYDENGLRETTHYIRVSYTQANPRFLKKDTKTIDDLMHKNKEAFLCNIVSTVSLYESKDYPDTYLAYLATGVENGSGSDIIDYEVVVGQEQSPRSIKDDVVFDKKTGVLYIPKSYYFAVDGTELGLDVNSQVLMVADDAKPELNIAVENDRKVALGKVSEKMEVSAYDAPAIPLVAESDASKVSFDDIEVYLNGSAARTDFKEGEGAYYDDNTGVYTIYQYGQTLHSIKFKIKGKTVGQKISDAIGLTPVSVHAAATDVYESEIGKSMKPVKNVSTGKYIMPNIDVEKIAAKDVYYYKASGDGSNHSSVAKPMLRAGQKNFVYCPYFPRSGGSHGARQKFYEYITASDSAENPKSLEWIDNKLSSLNGDGLVNQTEQEDEDSDGHDEWFWYQFVLDAPAGRMDEFGGRVQNVSFGRTEEWNWIDEWKQSGSAYEWCRHGFAAMCCHIGADAMVDAPTGKDIQMSVLEKGSDYVVLSLAGTTNYSGAGDIQCGAIVIKVKTKSFGSAKLVKKSSDPKISDGSNCYDLAGATYKVCTDKAMTDKVGDLVCKADGTTNVLENLTPGKYYVQETVNGKGYLLDKTIHEVTVVSGKTAVLNVTDIPAHTDPDIRIAKIDKETGEPDPQGDGELAGARFRISHYDTLDRDAWKGMSPKHVYIVETDEHGQFYMDGRAGKLLTTAEAGERSDVIPKDGNGTSVLLAGIYVIYEIKAPEGYLLPEGEDAFLGAQLLAPDSTDEDRVTKLQFRAQPEDIGRGGFTFQKHDNETKKNTPQGDATLGKGTYEIVNMSKNAVDVPKGGSTYAPEAVCFTFTTDEDGHYASPEDLLPYGTYLLREKDAPTGYLKEGTIEYQFEIRENEQIVNIDEKIYNDPKRGGVRIIKNDKELNKSEALGGANHGDNTTGTHLEQTQFTLKNVSETEVLVDGKLYPTKKTDESGCLITTLTVSWNEEQKAYVAETPVDYLPYGTYELQEVAVHESYLLTDGEPRQFEIREHGQIVTAACDEGKTPLIWSNQVVRGDVKIVKIANGTSKRLSVPFVIENVTTGEKHLMVTDKNGMGSTETSWNKHTTNTNANDKLLEHGKTKDDPIQMADADLKAGIYFGLGEDGSMAEADDGLCALPYGSYTMTELYADTNAGYEMQKFEFEITRNAVTVDAGTLTNDEPVVPELETKAFVTKTGSQMAIADGVQTVGDKVIYKDLKPGQEYELEASLMEVIDNTKTDADKTEDKADSDKKDDADADKVEDNTDSDKPDSDKDAAEDTDKKDTDKTETEKVTVKQLLNKDGKPYTTTMKFTPEKANGEVVIEIADVDFSDLAGKHLVFFEKLKLEGNLVGEHEDPEDEDQSLYVPKIGTELKDAETGEHYGEASKEAKHIDTVTYENLIPGKEYTMFGTLQEKIVDKDGKVTVEPVKDAKGKPVTAKKTFTPAEPNGEVEIEFTYDASLLAGKRVVAFEQCYEGGISAKTLIARHEDPEDEDQTVTLIKIGTVARDSQIGGHIMSLDGHIIDRVYYEGLTDGEKYIMRAVVMNKKGDKVVELKDKDGNVVTGKLEFVAGDASKADAEKPDKAEDKTDANAADKIDKDQVNVDQNQTDKDVSVADPDSDKKDSADTSKDDSKDETQKADVDKAETDGDQKSEDTDKDKAEDKNAETDADKKDAEKADKAPVADVAVTAPEGMENWGYVDVEIPLNVREHIGKNLVVFEYLEKVPEKTPEDKDLIVVAKHEDPDDDNQIVVVPKIATVAAAEDGSKVIKESEESIVMDTVTYENLEPGRTYVMKGVMHDKETGNAVEGSAGELEFTASEDGTGEVVVPIKVKTTGMNAKALVAFEECYDKEKNVPVAEHKDIEDMKQTVSVNEPLPENPKDTKTDGKGGQNNGTGSRLSGGASPKTGLNNPAVWFAGIGVFLIAGYVVVSRYRKKQK